MTLNDIRKKYLAYCQKHQHTIIPSSGITPENDPTTLFTGSGMQSLIPYLLGQKHPEGKRVANSQKCFRAEDIDEVGDNRHTTFFEMLGNWSLGDYFKEKQLPLIFSFLVEEIGLDPKRLYVTCFIGDAENDIPKDTESATIWEELYKEKGIDVKVAEIGSEADGGERGMKEGERIFYYDASKNWWSRVGVPENMPPGEPGGPDSEVFYDFGTQHDTAFGEYCHPNCDCGRFMEIGNNVFMEYIKTDYETFEKLEQKNVDFGGGLERIAAAANGSADVFSIDVFEGTIKQLETVTDARYSDDAHKRAFRIIADHLRGAIFMMAEGIVPSNKDQGYVLRRIIRRAIFYADTLGIPEGSLEKTSKGIIDIYKEAYPAVSDQIDVIITEIKKEAEQFRKTLEKGLREFEKMIAGNNDISGKDAFILFTTYGFPLELTQEMAQKKGIEVDLVVFEKEFKKHQELSKTASAGKFKGGLAEHSDKTTALHTATHLMLAGLRKYVGDEVHQRGSNITEERSRFDFTCDHKVERDVLDQVEDYVNEAITAGCPVMVEEMAKADALKAGVEGSFWEKYPDRVTVYTAGGDDCGVVYSRELCGGPHVTNTGDIKGTFKILKEKSSSAGVRRIKAVLEV